MPFVRNNCWRDCFLFARRQPDEIPLNRSALNQSKSVLRNPSAMKVLAIISVVAIFGLFVTVSAEDPPAESAAKSTAETPAADPSSEPKTNAAGDATAPSDAPAPTDYKPEIPETPAEPPKAPQVTYFLSIG